LQATPAPLVGYFSRRPNTGTDQCRIWWPIAYDGVNAHGMMMLDCRRSSRENQWKTRRDRSQSTWCTRCCWGGCGWYRKGCGRETTNETTSDEWTTSAKAGRTCTVLLRACSLHSAICAHLLARAPRLCIFFEGRRRGWVRWRGPAADRYGRRSNVSHESRAAVTGYNIIII